MKKPTSQFKILIVDAEAANAAALTEILSPEYAVTAEDSGVGALRAAEGDRPDMILLDEALPDISGYKVLAALKSRETTHKIPVIMVAGAVNERDEERGFLLGAVDYIIRPLKRAIVRARVRTHLEIVRQMRAIERLGLTDPLTGIPNRRSFDDRLHMEWRRAIREKRPLSFLMMDIDNFAKYNDTYGHPQGDILLKAAAEVCSTWGRRPADHPARLGGEAFGVLLPDTDLDAALSIAEHIRADVEALRVPTEDERAVTQATVSVGVASTVPTGEAAVDSFLASADKSLFAAKTEGRNRIRAATEDE
ncbi:MAG: diguanylate cyclase [Clostridiales bacterium]|jgi:diguanylate cyclase (GGDEF)-like protein|nr:diguanylate cyclase [Clostridiales bacterium]